MYLVVGLGNPGKQYEATRHNMGFDVIDKLVEEYQVPQGGVASYCLPGFPKPTIKYIQISSLSFN